MCGPPTEAGGLLLDAKRPSENHDPELVHRQRVHAVGLLAADAGADMASVRRALRAAGVLLLRCGHYDQRMDDNRLALDQLIGRCERTGTAWMLSSDYGKVTPEYRYELRIFNGPARAIYHG